MLENFRYIDINRAGIDASSASCTRHRVGLFGVKVKFAEHTIPQTFGFCIARIMPPGDTPVSLAGAAIPAANALKLLPVLIAGQGLIPYIEAATRRTNVGADSAA
jgi:hypothetical protein